MFLISRYFNLLDVVKVASLLGFFVNILESINMTSIPGRCFNTIFKVCSEYSLPFHNRDNDTAHTHKKSHMKYCV